MWGACEELEAMLEHKWSHCRRREARVVGAVRTLSYTTNSLWLG